MAGNACGPSPLAGAVACGRRQVASVATVGNIDEGAVLPADIGAPRAPFPPSSTPTGQRQRPAQLRMLPGSAPVRDLGGVRRPLSCARLPVCSPCRLSSISFAGELSGGDARRSEPRREHCKLRGSHKPAASRVERAARRQPASCAAHPQCGRAGTGGTGGGYRWGADTSSFPRHSHPRKLTWRQILLDSSSRTGDMCARVSNHS